MSPQPTVVVTGANSGIGRSTALLLAENGFKVFATMRSLSRGEKLRALASEHALDITELEIDVTDEVSVRDGFGQVLQEHGHVDVLINNAGIGSNAAIEDIDTHGDKNVFETNFWE